MRLWLRLRLRPQPRLLRLRLRRLRLRRQRQGELPYLEPREDSCSWGGMRPNGRFLKITVKIAQKPSLARLALPTYPGMSVWSRNNNTHLGKRGNDFFIMDGFEIRHFFFFWTLAHDQQMGERLLGAQIIRYWEERMKVEGGVEVEWSDVSRARAQAHPPLPRPHHHTTAIARPATTITITDAQADATGRKKRA